MQQHIKLVQGRDELRDTACKLIGSLAAWLSMRHSALLQTCAGFVVHSTTSDDGNRTSADACKTAVQIVQAWPAAVPTAPIAEVRARVTPHVPQQLHTQPVMQRGQRDGLLTSVWLQGLCVQVRRLAQRRVQPHEVIDEVSESSCNVVNAAARLIGDGPVAEMQRLAPLLVQPLVDTLERAGSGNVAPTQVAHVLRMLATAFQFLGSAALSHGEKRRTVLQLAERCWPLLLQWAAGVAVQGAHVPDALCDVLTQIMSGAGHERTQLLPHVMPCLAALFRTCGHAACLAATTSIAEQAAPSDQCSAEALAHLYSCADGMLGAVQRSTQSAQGTPPDVLAASVTLVSRLALFHPQHALQPMTLAVGVELAMHALQQSERPTLQAATQAFAHLLAPSAAQQKRIIAQNAPAGALQQLVQQQAPALVRCLLVCLCRNAPQDSWTSLARVLYVLRQTHGASVGDALRGTLCNGAFEGLQGTPLTPEDCQKVAQLLTPQALPERRFRALVSDFAGIAHGVASSDDLLAYELPVQHGVVTIE